MCLAIPGKILEIYDSGGLRMGRLDFGGTVRECCLTYVPEAGIGDYAIIHVGFAISLMDEDEAMETLKLIKEVAAFSEETGLGNPTDS